MAVGAAGSGKSLILRCLMQSVLCDVGNGNGTHGLVYDPKNDAMSILHAFVNPDCIKLFNPLDARCVCWDTAKDIASPLECNQLAWALVPKLDQDSFFERAIRSIIRYTAMSFNLSKLPWTFADLLRALRDKETYAKILSRHPQTAHIVNRFLNDPKLSSDIDATLESVCGEFEPLAACFEKGSEKVSIKDCIQNESVIILGNYETCRESFQRLNLVLSSIYTHRVLSLPDYTPNLGHHRRRTVSHQMRY
jgi:Type IV secretion-system coupling protein DNA-binding domain